jgi:hypothetical protein
MTVQQIVDRAAYEVGDERFEFMSRDEYRRFFERAFREFCYTTFAVKGEATFTSDGSRNMPLYAAGPPIVGTDILAIYYAKYYPVGSTSGVKAYERTEDDMEIDSSLLGDSSYLESDYKSYTIHRDENKLVAYWSHTPVTGDRFVIKYYRLPLPDSLALDDEVPTTYTYQEDLVGGVTVLALKRMYILATRNKKGLTPDMAKTYFYPYKEAKAEWENRLLRIRRDVTSFLDDTIPLIMQVGSPFDNFADEEQILMEGE